MKLTHTATTLALFGMIALLGACDKKAEPAPVAPAEQAAALDEAPAAPATTTPTADRGPSTPKPGAAPAITTSKNPTAVADAPKDSEADCPFHDTLAKTADGDAPSCAGKADCDKADCPGHAAAMAAKAAAPEATTTVAAGGDEPGCAGHAAALAAKLEGTSHFGEAFTLTAATPLATALPAAKDGSEDVVKVSGKIAKVCQKKGCWMVVRDGEAETRVVFKGYSFTVPVDVAGKDAIVEGTLKVKTFTEAQAKHLAEDGGDDPSKVSGAQREYLLTATAVDIKS